MNVLAETSRDDRCPGIANAMAVDAIASGSPPTSTRHPLPKYKPMPSDAASRIQFTAAHARSARMRANISGSPVAMLIRCGARRLRCVLALPLNSAAVPPERLVDMRYLLLRLNQTRLWFL